MTISILIADDHELFRSSLRQRLAGVGGLDVVAEAEDGEVALLLTEELEPDVVIMDVVMPGMSGIEATRRIVAAHPEIRVIGLSFHSDPSYVEDMLAAGAVCYLLKDGDFQELVAAIRPASPAGARKQQRTVGC